MSFPTIEAEKFSEAKLFLPLQKHIKHRLNLNLNNRVSLFSLSNSRTSKQHIQMGRSSRLAVSGPRVDAVVLLRCNRPSRRSLVSSTSRRNSGGRSGNFPRICHAFTKSTGRMRRDRPGELAMCCTTFINNSQR